jgi:hypothetical protein
MPSAGKRVHSEVVGAAKGSRKAVSQDNLFWTAVAERSGDTAFARAGASPKRRGASLPAAVQERLVAKLTANLKMH